MDSESLVIKLKDMYENASKGEQTTMIRLFGIKYAEELKENSMSLKDIAEKATGYSSYGNEINKGIQLAKYVVVK